mmetsp:Transcript_49793/g.55586  ORF Transcript_49793/g.55586 Transcript_49793/m.55586 type:complete len:255 (-) Transcript_49793:391-1155(-)|eukprot:CAMPEP_0170781256 /NCGR_PEP_ID=MMETSP0733-20121128/14091_1 /TAXON_ID=186038 /ORGANISM="Fragilariopsis kerguelensis, Strain L26-C5" /LENGTH=254 /DNA_ID=CAMNT_0011125261 /DNA_START=249 /DNA_END=1013 /DNA_ORIENTATION=-
MTPLRLSSKPPLTMHEYIQRLSNDTSISLSQKNDCLKTLTVVLKNLIDTNKGGIPGDDGLKYRTLKLDNPKVKARLFPSSSSSKVVMDLLMDSTHVGMKPKRRLKRDLDINLLVMETVPSPSIQEHIQEHVLPAVTTTQADINSKMMAAEEEHKSHKKAKLLLAEHNNVSNKTVTPAAIPPVEKLSEKQLARRELEKKKQLEKEQDKQHRLKTKAQLAADKLVRETDENWKPAVSAAADKTGTGIQTFRDRHGE